MPVSFDLGVGAIRSYKRLAYTPWHALAEFVDNSTQSYADNKQALDKAYASDPDCAALEVSIAYDGKDDRLTVADNAMGMNRKELERALTVGMPPPNTSGRSQFGLGMKTAACWIGDLWTIRTKKLGGATEFTVTIDVDSVAEGNTDLDLRETPKQRAEHYTLIEIRQHHQQWPNRTRGKIRNFLRSMYRVDLREGSLKLMWQNAPLEWEYPDERFVEAPDGSRYRKPFSFKVLGNKVGGWVGILERGSRAEAGFSILHRKRVVRGWPDSWRPEKIYGGGGGRNDLINQRVVGEINLDESLVTHTKDGILWVDDEEVKVETKLQKACEDYLDVAKKRRKGDEDERGPSDLEVRTAVEEFEKELQSGELVDSVELTTLPEPKEIREGFKALTDNVDIQDPAFHADLAGIQVAGYLAIDASPNDPYVGVDATTGEKVMVIINVNHPHWRQISGAEGVLNYFRECTYDAIAEWQARHQASRLDPDTVKILKDRLLRTSFTIETHLEEEIEEAAEGHPKPR